jgi:hypothetical protein
MRVLVTATLSIHAVSITIPHLRYAEQFFFRPLKFLRNNLAELATRFLFTGLDLFKINPGIVRPLQEIFDLEFLEKIKP